MEPEDGTHSDAFFHHTKIKEIADKISCSVNQLYRDQPGTQTRDKPLNQLSDDDAGSGSEADGRKEWESEDEDEEHEVDDDWDIEQSKAQVQLLLGNLHTDKRFDVMTKLNRWFSDKADKVTHDIEQLTEMDDERNKNEDLLKKSHQDVNKELEEKEMHSFQVLNKFYMVLNSLGKKGREALDNEKKRYAKKAESSVLERQQEESKNADLENSIQNLRQRLLSKEVEMRKGLEEKKEDQPKASDLLQVIASQQDELAQLSSRIEVNEARVKTLKAALDYVTGQHTEEPDQAVLDTIEEIKSEVREAKMADLLQTEDAGQVDLKVPDESVLLSLENECITLRQQLKDLEDEIRQIKDPQDRTEAINFDKQQINVDNAAAAKAKLTVELSKTQTENERLQNELLQYESLIKQAEETLKVMEEQKVLFMENVANARKNLVVQPIPTEDDLTVPTQAIDNPADLEMLEKQKGLLASLKEEEQSLIAEIEELEQVLTSSRANVKQEKDRHKELEAETARQKQEYADVASQLESEVPETLEEEEAQLQALQQENDLLLSKMEDLQKKLEYEDRRAAMDEQAADEAEMLAREEFKKKKEELDKAVADAHKDTAPDTDPEPKAEVAPAEAAQSGKDTQEEKLAQLKAQQTKEMQELLKLQQENVELAKQIELIEMKIKVVKSNRGQPLDLSILKDTQIKEEDIPPENLELRKEVRKKQRELNGLRKKWWSERQDPKTSVRRNLVTNPESQAEAPDLPTEQFDKIKNAISET